MADDFYPPYDDEPSLQPQPEQPQPPPNFVPYKPEVQAQADQPPPNFVPYRPEPPPNFIPYRPQAAVAAEPAAPIKSAPPTATPAERRDIYGDEPIGLPRTPGGLSSTAGSTVTSTTPVQDIPAPKVNKQGVTLPTYILRTLGEGLVSIPETLTRGAGTLQRGELSTDVEGATVYDPKPAVDLLEMMYGARALAGGLKFRPIPQKPGMAPAATTGPRVTPEGQYQFPLEGQHPSQLAVPPDGQGVVAPAAPEVPKTIPRQGELPLQPPPESGVRHGTPGSEGAAGTAEAQPPPPASKATGPEDWGKKTAPSEGGSGVNVGEVDPTLRHAIAPEPLAPTPAGTMELPPVDVTSALPEAPAAPVAFKDAKHLGSNAAGEAVFERPNGARVVQKADGTAAAEAPNMVVGPGTVPAGRGERFEVVRQSAVPERIANRRRPPPEPEITPPRDDIPETYAETRAAPEPLVDRTPANVAGNFRVEPNPAGPGHVITRGGEVLPGVYPTKGPAFIAMNKMAREGAPIAPVVPPRATEAIAKSKAAEAPMPSEQRLRAELEAKPRAGWERNGFEDGLNGIETRGNIPHGPTRGSYMEGWRDGDQVRRMREAQGPPPAEAQPFRAKSKKVETPKPAPIPGSKAAPLSDAEFKALREKVGIQPRMPKAEATRARDEMIAANRAKTKAAEEAAGSKTRIETAAIPEKPAPIPGSKAAQRAEAQRAVEAFNAKKKGVKQQAQQEQPGPIHEGHTVERQGVTSGRFPSYRLIVDGVDLGKVQRKVTKGRDVAAGRSQPAYDSWAIHGTELGSQAAAEAKLIERAKNFGTLKDKPTQRAPQELPSGQAPPKVTPTTRPIEPTGTRVLEGSRTEVNRLLDQTMSAADPAAHLRETADWARKMGLEGQARKIEAAAAELERQRTVEVASGPGERSTGTLRQQAEHDPMDMVRKGELSAARAEELATHYKNRDKEIVDAVLGKDADAWRRAHKMSDQYWESGYNDAKARVQDKLVEALEAKHSPKAIEEMYRKMEQSEHADPQGWRDFARDLRDVEGSRENAVTTVGYTLRRLPEAGKTLGQIDRETLALIQHALDHEARRGGAPEPFLREAFAKSSERYGGGADAAEIIAGDMARLKELMTNPPPNRPALPAPVQRLIEFIKDERGGLFFGRKPSRTPAEEKVLSRLAEEPGLLDNLPKSREEVSSGWRDFYAGFKNEMDAIEQLKHRSLDPVAPEVDPGVLARLTRGLGGRVNQIINDGIYNVKTRQVVGDPLKTVMDKIKVDEPGFQAYAISRATLERAQHGAKTGVDLQAARQVVAQSGARWGPVLNELNVWKNHMLDNAVEILGSKAIADMKKKYPGHIALHRLLDPASETGQALGGGLQARNPLHRLDKGSEAPILNTLDSTIKDNVALLDMSERNRVGMAMEDLDAILGSNAKFLREVEDVHPIHITAAEVNKRLGIEGITEQVADGMKVFRKDAFAPAPDRIRVFRDGKAKVYEVDPVLGRAYHHMDAQSLHTAVKILGAPARWLRAGAVLAPEFALKNPFRDQLAAFTQAKYGYIPVYDFLVHGLPNLFTRGGKHTELFQRMAIEGMFNANMVSMDRRLMFTEPRTLLQHTANVVNTPIRLLQMFSEIMENATRLGIARRAMEPSIFGRKGAHPIEAAWEGREGTLDFQRVGSSQIVKIANHLIPFFNVTLEGTDRIMRAFRDRPVQTALTTIAGITLPSVALWYHNKNDERIQQLAQWRKDVAWNFAGSDNWQPISTQGRNEILDGMVERLPGLDISNLPNTFRQAKDGSWEYNKAIIWALPKPPGVGQLFGSIPERMLDAYVAKHPDAFKDLGKGIMQAFAPGIVPQVALPEVERWANKSIFMDRPLISPTLQKLPPSQHITPQTSDTAQAIGNAVRKVVGEKSTLGSPTIIDNYIRQWGGGLGKHVTDMLDYGIFRAKDAPVKPSWSAADVPLLKGFVARFPSGDAEAIKQFYDTYEERKMAAAGIKNLQKKGLPEDPTLLRENPVQGIHNALGVGFKTVRNIMDSKTMSADDKRAAIDLTYLFMIEKAKQGNKALEESKRKATPPPNFIPYRPEAQ